MVDERTLGLEKPILCGREVIYTSAREVNRGNILDIVSDAIKIHNKNQGQIVYLYNYYCGLQPILDKTKEYNDYVNNKIVVNRANEIVNFKTGYLLGKPIQYIARGDDEKVSDEVSILNDCMFVEDRESKNRELADWFTICGTSYLMTLARRNEENSDVPFHIYTLDPRFTFVVYSNGVDKRPLLGVTYALNEKGETIYNCYTDKEFYQLKDLTEIISIESHLLRDVPIVEYPANKQRIGEFEVVIDLLDAINLCESDRLDGIEQFVQSLMMFKGVDADDKALQRVRELGGICVPEGGDVKYLIQELNQTQTQVLMDDMYETVLTICGMPNRHGGASTSDNGVAVLLRDGWSAAETKAQNSETIFKSSERRTLAIALRIMSAFLHTNLRMSDIDIRFTRRNYENIQTKAQVLLQMLSTDKIHPQLAFEHCGMFSDANLAYKMSMNHYDEELKKQEEELNALNREEEDGDEGSV